MTGPNPEIGRAEIRVTADTSHFPQDAKKGVEEALRESEPSVQHGGEEWGEVLSDGVKKRFKSKVPEIVKQFEADLKKQKIHETINVDTDVDHDRIKHAVEEIAGEVEQGLSRSNILGGVGQAIADAVGAGFNVSGRSPLIVALIPVFGAIAALIASAVEAVYGLGAALLTIPNLLSAIVLQAGLLMFIFKDIASLVGPVFAARNAKELQDALFGIDLYTQNFLLELLYIRDAFKGLQPYLTKGFLQEFGNTLLEIFDFNRYTLFTGLQNLSETLGAYFATIGKAFETPQFAKFLSDLFKEIDTFLTNNGPALERFLTNVFAFLDSLMGATGDVGDLFNEWLDTFGNFLGELSKSKDFQEFLKQMPQILRDSGVLIEHLLDLVLSIFSATNRGGGDSFIKELTKLIDLLTWFFTTQNGADALRGLLALIYLLTFAFVALVIAIGSVFSTVQEFFDWLLGPVPKAVKDWFDGFGKAWSEGWSPISTIIDSIKTGFTFLSDHAFDWGLNLINNFVKGLLHNLPNLHNAMSIITTIASAYIPHSPAKLGPFSGEGAPYDRGVATMEDYAKGIMSAGDKVTDATDSVMNNVNFGTGAVIANFYGSQPTQDQAQMLGTAVGNGISDQLLQRNASLAVRTM